jgi:hypothetical protein
VNGFNQYNQVTEDDDDDDDDNNNHCMTLCLCSLHPSCTSIVLSLLTIGLMDAHRLLLLLIGLKSNESHLAIPMLLFAVLSCAYLFFTPVFAIMR